jgi:hypothetical protein
VCYLDAANSDPLYFLKNAKLPVFIKRFFLDKWVVGPLPKVSLSKYVHAFKAQRIGDILLVDDFFLYIFQ